MSILYWEKYQDSPEDYPDLKEIIEKTVLNLNTNSEEVFKLQN